MTTRITLPAFPHTLLGFDHLFAQFEKEMNRAAGTYNYPPHNVISYGDKVKIEIAVAGFKEEELSVTTANGDLIVAGKQSKAGKYMKSLEPSAMKSNASDVEVNEMIDDLKDCTIEELNKKLVGKAFNVDMEKVYFTEKPNEKYLHRGLALRDFELKFILGNAIKVSDVNLEDGILTINLEKIVPEEHKPKKLKINTK
jgi:HSP20 family molecular chaperone IbpA